MLPNFQRYDNGIGLVQFHGKIRNRGGGKTRLAHAKGVSAHGQIGGGVGNGHTRGHELQTDAEARCVDLIAGIRERDRRRLGDLGRIRAGQSCCCVRANGEIILDAWKIDQVRDQIADVHGGRVNAGLCSVGEGVPSHCGLRIRIPRQCDRTRFDVRRRDE